ncbi:extracellular solute-binding protein [Cyanobium sp. FACHB-13342]|nr:extracellular solute-binding protein [Cyanobium sp. FACHB-13342]
MLIVPNSSLEWYRSFYQEALPETDLLKAFRKLNPGVSIDISTVSESDLETRLRLSQSRGLGPDLLILQGPRAISLLEQGLLQPLPRKDPQLQRALSQVAPDLLNHAQGSRGLAGLPLFAEVTVACFDRRRITEPPTTLNNLLTVAAAGNPVGLSVDPSGIYWTAGALGAAQALKPILLPDTSKPDAALLTSQNQDLQRWLAWLRQSALQGKVYLGSGPEDLVTGLESGRLAWIPCFSPLLVRLNRTMGRHLGVAPLPDGPWGPAKSLPVQPHHGSGHRFHAGSAETDPPADGAGPGSGAAEENDGHEPIHHSIQPLRVDSRGQLQPTGRPEHRLQPVPPDGLDSHQLLRGGAGPDPAQGGFAREPGDGGDRQPG